ncbi:hypothetical protein CFK38_01725 [Brachybacterium vulturis]|uniref:DUF4190 domain-containing protein n=1 Tax=Brachybacterium vulturis TaxID=2017484 RepID=A0A291GIM8_9MICO|nr:hypothetical protein [Brachybacterium vulturis]ATG50383.1 hypothetical protein CFK38_01725 [Brachybacterium vulturis]
MTNARTTTDRSTMKLGEAPKTLWIGLVIGLIAFVVNLSFSSTSSENGVMTSCSYFDIAALGAAVACVVCGIASAVQRLRRPERYPFTAWVVYLLSAVLIVLSVIHALRAFGILGGPC